jgi:hypothetical protein
LKEDETAEAQSQKIQILKTLNWSAWVLDAQNNSINSTFPPV